MTPRFLGHRFALRFCFVLAGMALAGLPALPARGEVPRIVQVAAGGSHTCALQDTGTVWCWGRNDRGQLGDGSTVERRTPVRVEGFGGAVQVAAGRSHSCARMEDGTVWCWGDNSFGQLGNNEPLRRVRRQQPVVSPVPVVGLTRADQIALGESHSCARLDGGGVSCWGRNGGGQLGNGTRTLGLRSVPVAQLTGATQIAVGRNHSCARIDDGTVRCWGLNGRGQVDSIRPRRGRAPVRVPVTVPGLESVRGIALGDEHSCARLGDGSVRCWGSNAFGQLGVRDTDASGVQAPVRGLGQTVGIGAGQIHSCARLRTGTLRCWGSNLDGQLGNLNRSPRAGRVLAVRDLADVAQMSIGSRHGCALLQDDSTFCWGSNSNGQIGHGSLRLVQRLPVRVRFPD